ncbi:hypothetical protein OROMI_029938 [Orobanche minor]
MTTTMGPSPPRNSTAGDDEASTFESAQATVMDPPLARNPNPSETGREAGPSENHKREPELNPTPSDTTENPAQLSNLNGNSNNDDASDDAGKTQEHQNRNAAVPYTIPPWSGPPDHQFFIEVLKDGAIVDQYDVLYLVEREKVTQNKKGAYMFGRVDLCDFVLDHPTISRFHAVLQFKSNGGAYLYDLGSTHGTSINKSQVKKRVYVDLHVGDVIRFGQSSRLYIFQGPSDLMPPETDLKCLKNAKIRQQRQDMKASLLRAKASRADGISWGMQEDAIEEDEDDVDEITWQTCKGQLTEKQEKTREKVIKRLEKIAHMKKEIDAIRAKDIAQGGLTQGQQTQIARNEQRMSQIMEELENLEETLNESIRESLGARGGKTSRGKRKGTMEDEEEEDYVSDEDEFYDRAKKSLKHKSGENQSVETADSLLDKKDALVKQIEAKEKLILGDDKPAETNEVVAEAGDALDAYMSAVSSQLVLDSKEKLRKEISILQSELDRILYLLRIADPTGEAAKKRQSKAQKPETVVKKKLSSDVAGCPPIQNNHESGPSFVKIQDFVPEVYLVESNQEKSTIDAKSESNMKKEEPESLNDESKATVYTAAKPQWLGAVENRQKQEVTHNVPSDTKETVTDQFVDYKDRVKILNKTDSPLGDPGIEDAAPGLIIRKRKQLEKSNGSEVNESGNGSGFKVEDVVALLLKHSRGYHASEEKVGPISEDVVIENEARNKDDKKAKRVSGPDRPLFLDEPDCSTWVPPEVNRVMGVRR